MKSIVSTPAINPPPALSRADGKLLAAMDSDGPKPITIFTVTFVDAGGDSRPIPCRLKQWLKLGLRGFRLRCIESHASDGSEFSEIQP